MGSRLYPTSSKPLLIRVRSGVGLFCHLIGKHPPQNEINQVDKFLRHGYLSTALISDLFSFNPAYKGTGTGKDSSTKNALHVLVRLHQCTEIEARDILAQEIEKSQKEMMDGYMAWKTSDAPRSAQAEDYAALAILYIGGSNQWIIASHPDHRSDRIDPIAVSDQPSTATERLSTFPTVSVCDQSSINCTPPHGTTETAFQLADQSTDTYDTMRHLFDHPIPWKIRLRRALPIRGVVEWASEKTKSLATSLIRRNPVPSHVAFVLDGNRRWAKSHGASVALGHVRGLEKVLEASSISPAVASPM